MHTLVTWIAIPVLIPLSTLQMAAKNESGLCDFAAMAIISLVEIGLQSNRK
jgi:hypothetical protein